MFIWIVVDDRVLVETSDTMRRVLIHPKRELKRVVEANVPTSREDL